MIGLYVLLSCLLAVGLLVVLLLAGLGGTMVKQQKALDEMARAIAGVSSGLGDIVDSLSAHVQTETDLAAALLASTSRLDAAAQAVQTLNPRRSTY